jgi:hypothetical protein
MQSVGGSLKLIGRDPGLATQVEVQQHHLPGVNQPTSWHRRPPPLHPTRCGSHAWLASYWKHKAFLDDEFQQFSSSCSRSSTYVSWAEVKRSLQNTCTNRARPIPRSTDNPLALVQPLEGCLSLLDIRSCSCIIMKMSMTTMTVLMRIQSTNRDPVKPATPIFRRFFYLEDLHSTKKNAVS